MIYKKYINKNKIKGGYFNMYSIFEKYADNEEFLQNSLITFGPPCGDDYTNGIKITMWETTKLRLNDALLLNKHKAIFVPSESIKKVFIESGVTRPIEVFDGFIDDVYTYQPHKDKNKLIFGLGFNKSLTRKNEINTIDYFLEAFEGIDDVELWIKTDQVVNIEDNEKIKIFYDNYSNEQMMDWYSNLDIFVSLSKGEGIGMFNLESMAVGRPLIANLFLTVQDYLNDQNGYLLDYDLVRPKELFYFDCGRWSSSKKESVINTFKQAYNNKHLIKEKGILASKTAERYKASIAVPKLIQKLKQYV
jgi:glycosyltransferase involved in cell wall biosynthesis